MDNLNQTFETLKRVNTSLNKINQDLLLKVEILVKEKNIYWSGLQVANNEIDKLVFTLAEIRERNQQLEQMLGAISTQCEKELTEKDRLFKMVFDEKEELRQLYMDQLYQNDNLQNNRRVELNLLVSIIRGEI